MRFPLFFTALALLFSTPAWAQDYAIKLSRPLKVGAKHRVESTGRMKQTTVVSISDKPVQNEKVDLVATYDGEETTLAANQEGVPTKTSIKIAKLTATKEGRTEEILAKGTVVVATKLPNHVNSTLFEVNGEAVENEVAQLLGLCVGVGHGGPFSDGVFGSKEKRKVGESWDIDAKRGAEEVRAQLDGRAEEIVGKGTLVSVDGEVQKISVRLSGKFMPPLPEGFKFNESSIEMSCEGEFPLNTAEQRRTETGDMRLRISAEGHSPQGKVNVQTDMQHTRSTKVTPVK